MAGSPTALHLDGTDGEATTPAIGLPAGNTAHTIEAWIYRDDPADFEDIRPRPQLREWILHLGGLGTGHHWLMQPDGTIQFGAWARDAQVGGPKLEIGRWTHVAATWDGAIYRVYFDGINRGQTASVTGFDVPADAPLLFGRVFGAENRFLGSLDEVRVWNRALSEEEIRFRMNLPLSGSEANLLVYLPFDEGQGGTGYDYAPAGGRANAFLHRGLDSH